MLGLKRTIGHLSVFWVHPCNFLGAFHVHRGVTPWEKRAEHPWDVTGNALYMSWAENLVSSESILEEGESKRHL